VQTCVLAALLPHAGGGECNPACLRLGEEGSAITGGGEYNHVCMRPGRGKLLSDVKPFVGLAQVLLMPLQMVEVANPHAACCIRRVEEQMLREDDK
jgi:hypothetical protein